MITGKYRVLSIKYDSQAVVKLAEMFTVSEHATLLMSECNVRLHDSSSGIDMGLISDLTNLHSGSKSFTCRSPTTSER